MKAKFIYESINDILRPKSNQEIEYFKNNLLKKIRIKYLPRLKELKENFDELEFLHEYLEDFYYEKEIWLGPTNRKEIDLTEEAKQCIKDATKNLGNKPIKVYQTKFFTHKSDIILSLLLSLGPLKNPSLVTIDDEGPYKFIYEGELFVSVGDPRDNFWVYFMPIDFLEKIFNDE